MNQTYVKDTNLFNFSNPIIHNLKIKHGYWIEVWNGSKPFEVRLNDRNFKKGDLIQFDVVNDDENITMQSVTKYIITYVLDYPEALKEGYVVLGIRPYK